MKIVERLYIMKDLCKKSELQVKLQCKQSDHNLAKVIKKEKKWGKMTMTQGVTQTPDLANAMF